MKPYCVRTQFVKRTRIIQKIRTPTTESWGTNSRISGTCTLLGSKRGNPLVNAEPAANASPRHMRHRWRAIRGAPESPPATTTLASAMTAKASTAVKT